MTLTKTQRLAELFPDAYAGDDPASLLHRLLDVFGAELARGDEDVKRLLKSHWVAYASGPALDGLGAVFGVTRRRLPGGTLEPDETFRQRLRAIVPLFTGGGTIRAVLGAVRSALGLPVSFDAPPSTAAGLAPLPPGLRADLEALVTLEEFVGETNVFVGGAAAGSGAVTELRYTVDSAAVAPSPAELTITLAAGTGWRLRVERLDRAGAIGVASKDSLFIPAGTRLVLSTGAGRTFRATLDAQDVTASFTAQDGSGPPVLPDVPAGRSDWRIQVRGTPFDGGQFDVHTFDLPALNAELKWRRAQPLTFAVTVPYHLKDAVRALARRHSYPDEIFVFEGLPQEAIQQVVDQASAAGVRGTVNFSVRMGGPETNDRLDMGEQFKMLITHRTAERIDPGERAGSSSFQRATDTHDATDRVRLGGVFDVSTFDNESQGFL